MSDLISRQEAIDALENDKASLDHIIRGMSAYDVRLDAYVSQRNQVDCDIDTINNLPTAQPMRPKGKWIADVYGDPICSECGWYAPRIMQGSLTTRRLEYYKSDFCWNCGADMRGDPDE